MNRRKMLTLLGATGVNMFSGYSSGSDTIRRTLSCVVTPQQTEGPYFVDERLRRSDIRRDPSDGSIKEGLPLALEIRVFSASTGSGADDEVNCKPITGAVVDVWHCDAQGIYSDVVDDSFNTLGQKFLRGYQVTDPQGSVRFITIYPGWYPGRAVHIHFKIRTDPKYLKPYEFTSQLYFNDSISDLVYAQHPAYARKASSYLRRARNEDDGIFRKGGEQLMLALVETGKGYATTFDVGLETR